MLNIYTDGACSSTDNTGGWAVVIVGEPTLRLTTGECNSLLNGAKIHFDPKQNCTYVYGCKPNTTNNEMELHAMQVATYIAASYLHEPVIINTDSAYIANCFRDKWYERWENNNWLTARKTPVEHKQMWQLILHNYRNSQALLSIQHVRAHEADHYNNLADTIAVSARQQLREDIAEKEACRNN